MAMLDGQRSTLLSGKHLIMLAKACTTVQQTSTSEQCAKYRTQHSNQLFWEDLVQVRAIASVFLMLSVMEKLENALVQQDTQKIRERVLLPYEKYANLEAE